LKNKNEICDLMSLITMYAIKEVLEVTGIKQTWLSEQLGKS